MKQYNDTLYDHTFSNIKKVSPKQYLKLAETGEIKSARFVPPQIGSFSLGYFLVKTNSWNLPESLMLKKDYE